MLPAIDASTAKQFLADVSPLWRAFWFHMHLMAKNLDQFAAGLEAIDDSVYAYHVTGHRNEIARWIQEVIGDAELARAMTDVLDRRQAAFLVRERIAELRGVAA